MQKSLQKKKKYIIEEYSRFSLSDDGIIYMENRFSNKIDKIIEIAERNKKHITIKPSINSYILKKRPDAIKEYDNIASACEFLEYFDLEFNIRFINEKDDFILIESISSLIEKKYFKYNKYQFNRYGRAEDNNELPDLKITNVYKNWKVYSCDGVCFNRDLIKRSYYEKSLSK